jgi:hypothetical protein
MINTERSGETIALSNRDDGKSTCSNKIAREP